MKYEVIVVLIILLVTGTTLILGETRFAREAGTSVEKASCQEWVDGRSLKTAGLQYTEFLGGEEDIYCITREIKMGDEGKEDLYKNLADELYDCWDMYRRGKKDFYSDWDWGLIGDTHCRVCSEVLFEHKTEIDINDFENYLETHNPNSMSFKGTYAEFLLNVEDAKLKLGESNIEREKDSILDIVFMVKKGRKPWSSKEGVAYTGTGCIGGAIGLSWLFGVGAVPGCIIGMATPLAVSLAGQVENFYPSILLIKREDIKKYGCTNIYVNKKNK